MIKKNWTIPMATVERFQVTEYVAACNYSFKCNLGGRFYVGVETSGDEEFHDHTYWVLTDCERGKCSKSGDRVYGEAYYFTNCNEVHTIPTAEADYFNEKMYLIEETEDNVYADPIKALGYTPPNGYNHASTSAWSLADLTPSGNS